MKSKKVLLSVFFASVLAFVSCSSGNSDESSLALVASLQNSVSNKPAGLFEFCGDRNYKSPHDAEPSQAKNQSAGLDVTWWKQTSFYHIWVKSFCDSNNDGCGDLKGIEQKLDYIQNQIGCDGIWLSPIFECGYKDVLGNMHGYDTTDYYALNPLFGTEQDLEELLNAAHSRGMKIIFDFVPNHTSNAHPWFIDSASSQKSEKRSWYMWNPTKLNWNNYMNEGNWHGFGSSYYYGAFVNTMPDLNYRNYEVREEMKNVVRYWLNKGFDGIRVDAVRYLIENSANDCCDTDESVSWFQELRAELDKYASPKFMVAESWITDNRPLLDKYFGSNGKNAFHMLLDFDQGSSCINTFLWWNENIIKEKFYPNKDESTAYGTFMVNHDNYNDRIATIFAGYPAVQKLATALSLLRPTVPFIYYGTECGLKQTTATGDVRLRANFDWDLAGKQETEENSLLKLNKVLNGIRKSYPKIFANGKVKFLSTEKSNTCAYTLSGDDATLLCVFNNYPKAYSLINFSGCPSFSSASCIIGDKKSPEIKCDNGNLAVKNIAPYSFRVYLLDSKAENLWAEENFTDENADYYPIKEEPTVKRIYSEMYLRGSFNDWGAEKMQLDATRKNFFCELTFNASIQIEYKFCETSGAAWGDNWGDPNIDSKYNNFVKNVKAGKKYRFSISITGENPKMELVY